MCIKGDLEIFWPKQQAKNIFQVNGQHIADTGGKSDFPLSRIKVTTHV